MADEVVLYRSDVQGLKPGGPTGRMVPWYEQHREYTYATTSLDVARAFGVFAFGSPRDHPRSVYTVRLDDPIVFDPEFRSDEYVSFYMSHWGAVLDVVEETVAMTVDEAHRAFARYVHWVDESPVFDDDGYPTIPPKWQNPRFDKEEIHSALRTLSTYPNPNDVLKFLEQHFR